MCRVSSPRSTTTFSIASSKAGVRLLERVADLVEVAAVRARGALDGDPAADQAAEAGGVTGALDAEHAPAGRAGRRVLGRGAAARADRRGRRPVRRRRCLAVAGLGHSRPSARAQVRCCGLHPVLDPQLLLAALADCLLPLRAAGLVDCGTTTASRRGRPPARRRAALRASSILRPFGPSGSDHDLLAQLEDRVDQHLRPRRAAGQVHVDRHDVVDALHDRVVVEHAAARRRRRPSRCTDARLGHLVVDLAQDRGHLLADPAGHDHQVGLPGRGAEDLHAPAAQVVVRVRRRPSSRWRSRPGRRSRPRRTTYGPSWTASPPR